MFNVLLAAVIILPIAAILVSAFITFNKRLQGKSSGKAMKFNLLTFAVIAILVCTMTFMAAAEGSDNSAAATDTSAAAQTETEATANNSSNGLGLLAAGLVTGLAGIGGGIAVAAGAPAAIAATSEDPKSFGKSLIFVALGESIALYGVVISILILNKV
ncbi:MAG: ATP synthase subunit C [Acutalibacteraceae bacterium]|nr:ATP synthase subunit C [Oscillospiraceae bacterium]